MASTSRTIKHRHVVVRDGRTVDVVTGAFGCVLGWAEGEWCEVMLTPAREHDLCLTHRYDAIVPNPPRGDMYEASDLAAWFRALESAGTVRRSSHADRRLRRLAAYGIHSAFRERYAVVIAEAVAAGIDPNGFAMRALYRRAASHHIGGE